MWSEDTVRIFSPLQGRLKGHFLIRASDIFISSYLAPITSLLGLIITTKLPLCVPFSRTAKDISSSTVDNKHVIYLPRLILSCHSCHLDRSGVPKIVELLIWIHMKTRGNRGDEKSRPSQDGLGVCCCDERVRFPDEPERARHWRLC